MLAKVILFILHRLTWADMFFFADVLCPVLIHTMLFSLFISSSWFVTVNSCCNGFFQCNLASRSVGGFKWYSYPIMNIEKLARSFVSHHKKREKQKIDEPISGTIIIFDNLRFRRALKTLT